MNGKYWDRAWSLVDGCTPCSPGCDNCWSASMAQRLSGNKFADEDGNPHVVENGRFTGEIILHPDRLNAPLKRKKPTVYQIWNDLFHEDVPLAFIDDALDVISACPQHTFLALTKQAHLIDEKLYGVTSETGIRNLGGGDFLRNLWIGVTVCNQEEADLKIPLLLKSWPGKKWLSVEPMLGPIDPIQYLRVDDMCPRCGWIPFEAMADYLCIHGDDAKCISCGVPLPANTLDAVVLGGETGSHARPIQPDWVRSVRDQCEAAGVPFFFKQWGKHIPVHQNRSVMSKRLLDGREHNELSWRHHEGC